MNTWPGVVLTPFYLLTLMLTLMLNGLVQGSLGASGLLSRRSPGQWQSGWRRHVDRDFLFTYEQPGFDAATPRNVTGQLGQTVYLHCVVRHLGDKTVSWIRRRDFHVLTVGLATYTSDDRFQSVFNEHAQDWMLQIKLTQVADAGSYECQVNSHPLISLFVHLSVLVPRATIREGTEMYIKTGSSINLTCVVSQSPEPPVFIFWYHDERMINYDESRGGEISMAKAGPDSTISRLHIPRVQTQDSGNYTCGPSNAEPTRISVLVLNGEQSAAMQHDLGGPSGSSAATSSASSSSSPRPASSGGVWETTARLSLSCLALSSALSRSLSCRKRKARRRSGSVSSTTPVS